DMLVTAGVLESCPFWQIVDLEIEADEFLNQMSQQIIDDNNNDNHAFILLNTPCAEPVVCGKINTRNSAMVAKQLDIAHQLATNKTVAAIVTGPLQKSALIDADIKLLDGTMFSRSEERRVGEERAGLLIR